MIPLDYQPDPLDPAAMTGEELDAIGANGCGSKGGWPKVPDHCWAIDCCTHDVAYWIGGAKADRKQADEDFLDAMLLRCDHMGHGRGHSIWSWAYFKAVRLCGKTKFHGAWVDRRFKWMTKLLGQKHIYTGIKRTRADLDAAVELHRQQEAE